MIPVLKKLCLTQYRSVSGVRAVDSGVPGPTAAILACTHGNEPAGVEAIDYLLSDLRLKRGRILFIIVNPQAARQQVRYIDRNMNRLPDHPDDWAGTVEGARLAELRPLLYEIDGGVLDLHSTSADAPPMLLCVDEAGYEAACCDSIPFRHIVSGISRFLSGRFLIEACVHAPLKLLAECGQHDNPDAADRAVEMGLAFLQRLEMVAPVALPYGMEGREPVRKERYRVKAPVRLPKDGGDFRLVTPIAPFEWIEEGRAIATNGSETVSAPVSGHAIMCPKTDGALDCNEALLFLCEKAA